MIRLVMQSEYSTWWIALAALLGAASVAWFYLRETRSLPLPQKYLLPALRALAIMMVILMLAGPVIEYRREIGQIPTVHVFVDASSSMLRDDITRNDNKLTRLQRAEQIVLGNADQVGMLPPFKGTHKVRCYVLSGEKAVSLYDNTSNVDAPKSITDPSMTLDVSATDLSDPLAQSFDRLMNSEPGDQDPNQPATEDVKPNHADTIVLLSDGQHNFGPSPEALAKRLGDLSVPVFHDRTGASERAKRSCGAQFQRAVAGCGQRTSSWDDHCERDYGAGEEVSRQHQFRQSSGLGTVNRFRAKTNATNSIRHLDGWLSRAEPG